MKDRINLIETESKQLQEYLESLSGSAWDQPSACDLWTVADVVAHLTWASDYFHETISNGIQGNVSPPVGWPEQGSMDAGFFAGFIAQKAIDARRAWGDGMAMEFGERYSRLQELFANLTDEEMQQPCYSPFQSRTPQNYVATRIQELAIHGWDVKSKLETSAGLSSASIPVVLERFAPWLESKNLADFRPPSSNSSPVRCRFDLGLGSSNCDVISDSEGSSLAPAAEDTAQVIFPQVVFQCAGEAAGLLAYGRLPVEQALSGDKSSMTGDHELGAELLTWLGQH